MDIQGNCSRCSFTIPIEFIKFELKRFRDTGGGEILEETKMKKKKIIYKNYIIFFIIYYI